MDVTFVIGNNSWRFHDDTMMGTWWKRCDGRTDGQTDRRTDRRTDGRTDWTSHIAAWSQLKKWICKYIQGFQFFTDFFIYYIAISHTVVLYSILYADTLSLWSWLQTDNPRPEPYIVCIREEIEPRCITWRWHDFAKPSTLVALCPPVTGDPLLGESTGHWCIPLTKGQ